MSNTDLTISKFLLRIQADPVGCIHLLQQAPEGPERDHFLFLAETYRDRRPLPAEVVEILNRINPPSHPLETWNSFKERVEEQLMEMQIDPNTPIGYIGVRNLTPKTPLEMFVANKGRGPEESLQIWTRP